MDAKILYKEYSPKTVQWMDQLIKTMEQELGDLPDSYRVSLDLLADATELYFKALEEIQNNGLIVVGQKGEKTKNPAIPIINSTQLFIHKMLSSFGLTLISKQKIKSIVDNDSEDPIEEFL